MLIRRTYQLDGEPTPGANPPVGNPTDLGGYESVDKLVAGYRNSSTEAQRQKARADALEGVIAQLQQPQRAGSGRPEDRLTELGIPVDALDQVINARLQQAFEPIAKGMTARTSVVAQYPDYAKYESDVANFVNADAQRQARYNAMWAADPAGAMEWGMLAYGEHQRRSTQAPPDNGVDRQKKVDAQIPGSRQTEGRARVASDPDGDSAALGKALDAIQKARTPQEHAVAAQRYSRLRMKNMFSEGFFDK